MKMKNLFFIGIAVLLAFSSCKDKAISIVGTWKLDRVEVVNNPILTGILNGVIQEMLGPSDLMLVFRENGTYRITADGEADSGTWSRDGGKLIMDGGEIPHTLSRDRLSLHSPEWLFGEELLEMLGMTDLSISIHFDRQ